MNETNFHMLIYYLFLLFVNFLFMYIFYVHFLNQFFALFCIQPFIFIISYTFICLLSQMWFAIFSFCSMYSVKLVDIFNVQKVSTLMQSDLAVYQLDFVSCKAAVLKYQFFIPCLGSLSMTAFQMLKSSCTGQLFLPYLFF